MTFCDHNSILKKSLLHTILGVSFCRDSITTDILQGCVVVTLTLLAFIGLVWLREQIVHGGGPEWLDVAPLAAAAPAAVGAAPAGPAAAGDDDEPEAAAAAAAAEPNPALNQAFDMGEWDNPDGGLPAEPEAPPEVGHPHPDDDEPAAANNNDGNPAANDDGQWNPMEWDRAADELTWERLLGLDGSLVFLEHVFWVVSLNTLFIVVFGEF